MSDTAQTNINAVTQHRPRCSKCGGLTTLARIEPSDEPHHDLRMFECVSCGNEDVVTVKFK